MAKESCESSNSLSVFWLRKYDYFCGWKSGVIKWTSGGGHESSVGFTVDTTDNLPHIRFNYTQTGWDGEKEKMNYRVELETTSCHFGGKRHWFICPLVKNGVACRRRVGILYIAGKYFGCRQCYDLAYRSQKDGPGYFRAFGKFFDLDTKIKKEEKKIRVRYWKGRPTKRYAKFLQKMRLLGMYGSAATKEIEDKKRRCYNGRNKA